MAAGNPMEGQQEVVYNLAPIWELDKDLQQHPQEHKEEDLRSPDQQSMEFHQVEVEQDCKEDVDHHREVASHQEEDHRMVEVDQEDHQMEEEV